MRLLPLAHPKMNLLPLGGLLQLPISLIPVVTIPLIHHLPIPNPQLLGTRLLGPALHLVPLGPVGRARLLNPHLNPHRPSLNHLCPRTLRAQQRRRQLPPPTQPLNLLRAGMIHLIPRRAEIQPLPTRQTEILRPKHQPHLGILTQGMGKPLLPQPHHRRRRLTSGPPFPTPLPQDSTDLSSCRTINP